ncbi:serine/threonine-protein kinase [Thermocatellispora tengchongensis]|uniref:serine/threonine-protein kinase n=1 Tax=Thermocatellispora tengchongensis TaxID=1073253 RepID=UPI002483B0D4
MLEQIASGGMSAIWRAFDQSLHRMVAVKVLDGPLGADHAERELIRREARATARLIHPDAIEVYDYGETVTSDGRMAAYVVMRLLDGTPLAERIAEGPLPWREAVGIAARVATVLAAAHERGVVHRDVTAENVLLTPDGAKLLDFGIAAFVGEPVSDRVADYGTPPYVAPERLTGAPNDPAVDVYSLGVLLFAMLTGHTPYPETTWEEIEKADRSGPPPMPYAPGLPHDIAALCRRCLDADPARRPKMQRLADVLTQAAAPPGGPVTVGMPRGVAVTLSVAMTVAAALGVVGWTDAAAPPEPSEAAASPLFVPAPRTEPTPFPTPTPATKAYRATSEPVAEPTAEHSAGAEVARITRVTLREAVDAFTATVDTAEANRLIERHVAVDLVQVAGNLLSGDPAGALDGLRTKVRDRDREGLLPHSVRQALEVRLSMIEDAVRAPSRT